MDWRSDYGNYLIYQERSDWLVSQLARIPHWASVLDIGCNAGRDLRTLARLGYSNLTGLDINDAVLSLPWPLQIIRADVSILPRFRAGAFDLVISVGVLEHVLDESLVRYIDVLSAKWIAVVSIDNVVGENYRPYVYRDLWPEHDLIIETPCPDGLFENRHAECLGMPPYMFRLFEK